MNKKEFVRLIKQYKWVLSVFVCLIALFWIFKFDIEIVKGINSIRNPFLDGIMFFVTYSSTAVIVLVPLFFAFKNKKLKEFSISIIGTYLLVVGIKIVIQRIRPFNYGLNTPFELIKPQYSEWDYGFPSNHAATSMASWFFIPKNYRGIWMFLSFLIMFSRVYFGLHYLSDILFGAFIGYFMSYFINKSFSNK